jgi:hypothetical protein
LVNQLSIQQGFDIDHIQQFFTPWELISDVNLYQEILDDIGWEFRSDGTYSTKSAYKMKFEGINSTSLNASSLKVLGSSLKQIICLVCEDLYG